MGVGLTHSFVQAVLFAAAAGSSGEVGTKPGMARGPAQ
ncbi:hypothetical protein BZL30_3634 [Mycobacterium kansasii]|uniref:Uncharacterized protein n=1 Tax=Mycobacterium kansasii TaxID=1768 RepID=A0A1V3XAE1_MYCKA|nr:hypothetical protein BZL30_3634 [Mycobacterium kansasii]